MSAPKPSVKTFGQRLREARELLGMSQTAFAELGGVQKRTQINYEGDKRRPDASYLAAVAAAGVDVQFVVTDERVGRRMNSFNTVMRRLMFALRVSKEGEVAQALGLSTTAFSERKRRGSFPHKELLALAARRPRLGIDVQQMLYGSRGEAEETLPAHPERRMSPAGLFAHQSIALDMISAYSLLSPDLQVLLEVSFAGGLNVADTHELAVSMLEHTRPDHMALVLTRLLVMANEVPDASLLTQVQNVNRPDGAAANADGLVAMQDC